MNDSADKNTVQPITPGYEQHIRDLTGRYIRRAGNIYHREFPAIPVIFDLKGRAAGMYRVQNSERIIRYNPYIFAKFPDDNITSTVPHEVAHYVVDMLYGATNVRPHGAEWQKVMLSLDAQPIVTGDYDLSGIPVRRQRRHPYQCACSVHQISAVRHNKIRRGKARYFCRYCKTPIISAAT
jgi:SprT protein